MRDDTKATYAGPIEVSITATQRITKAYYSAGKLVAMRVITSSVFPLGTLHFVHSDHLGSTSLTTDAGGAIVSEQKFKAWGVVRASNGTMPTDIGYTGQYADGSTGLMFYNARYYSQAIGRFISADTIVPGAGNPQAFNRYSYSYNNPLKYTDPTGHCPTPDTSDLGEGESVICVDLFIASDTIFFGSGIGDNRTYDSNSAPDQSRGYVYIYVDKNGKVIKDKTVPHINQSCTNTPLGCQGPYLKYNTFSVTQDEKTNQINVEWDLMNGVSGSFATGADNLDGVSGLAHPTNVASTVLRIFSHFPTPTINGSLQLRLKDDGKYEVSGERDPFPSLEVYQYTKTKVDKVGTFPEEYGPVLGPFFGLSPLSPRQVLK